MRYLCLVFLFSFACQGPETELSLDEKHAEFQWLVSKFEHNYAPLHYKEQLFGYDWQELKASFKERISEQMDNDAFRILMHEFVSQVKDAHTSLLDMYALRPGMFQVAYLGFHGVRIRRGENDGLLIAGLLPSYQGNPQSFPLAPGEIVMQANGIPIFDFVKTHCPLDLGRDDSTKTVLIPYLSLIPSLNCRLPADATVTLTVDNGASQREVSLPWVITDYHSFLQEQQQSQASNTKSPSENNTSDDCEHAPLPAESAVTAWNLKTWLSHFENKYKRRATHLRIEDFSVTPLTSRILLNPILESPSCLAEQNGQQGFPLTNPVFDLRFYLTEKGPVGYIKIVDFQGGDYEIQAFHSALQTLQQLPAQGLIIDLVDNGGGSLTYGQALASLLRGEGEDPSLTVRFNDNWLGSIKNQIYFAENPSTRTLAQQLLAKIEQQQQTGQWLTDPFTLSELMLTSPSTSMWSSPIVVMINEMCASMCDIFAADLQDHQVARFIGTNSMGAGGNVETHAFSPRLNLMVNQTESLVIRKNGAYIENLGVAPDRHYHQSASDLLNGNEGFKHAAVQYLLEEL